MSGTKNIFQNKKLIITIQQCKRIALPYIFTKHYLPRFQKTIDTELFLIRHIVPHGRHFGDKVSNYESKELPNFRIENIRSWTKEGRYEGAKIFEVEGYQTRYPSLFGIRKALEILSGMEYDYHLWLEDDAIVNDFDLENWELISKDGVGIYETLKDRAFKVAFYVSTKPFDKRLQEEAADWNRWKINQEAVSYYRIEGKIKYLAGDNYTFLNRRKVARIHLGANAEKVNKLVSEVCPKELSTLNLDFPKLFDKDGSIINDKEPRGVVELKKSHFSKCPICKFVNYSEDFYFVKTDFLIKFECFNCGKEFISYRNITTLSEQKISCTDEENKYSKTYHFIKSNYESTSIDLTKIESSKEKHARIMFYVPKTSISDVFYCLPGLAKLVKDEHKVTIICQKRFEDLVPAELVFSKLLLLNRNSSQLNEPCFNEFHKTLKHLTKNKKVTSNYPGTLPYSPQEYLNLSNLISKQLKLSSYDNDIIIFGRIKKGSRSWPNSKVFENLSRKLIGYKYKFLFFPEFDEAKLPEDLKKNENVILDPSIREQISICKSSKVCLTPHGASEVIPCITQTPIVELETEPTWWKDEIPQPIRYGLPQDKLIILKSKNMNEISVEEMMKSLEKFL